MKQSKKDSTPLDAALEYVEFSDGTKTKVVQHLQFSITEDGGVFSCGQFSHELMGEAIAAMMKEHENVRAVIVTAIAADMAEFTFSDVIEEAKGRAAFESRLSGPFKKVGRLPEA